MNFTKLPTDCTFDSISDAEQWGDSRELSTEEVLRIMYAADTMAHADKIWENEDWYLDADMD